MGYEDVIFPKNTVFLVTGGAGFIGSNITEVLLNTGNRVCVLDNFITGKKENIINYKDHPNFELIEGDIRDIGTCQLACKGIDYVLHQAALGSVPKSVIDPITTNEININGTLNMLVAAKDNNVKRFIYASSSSIYGDIKDSPKVEQKVGEPLSPYAITKKVNELYSNNFFHLFGLETVGLRYFNVFGKRQDSLSSYAAVIPVFISKLLKNERPIINGDGRQSRDFTFIENIVEANLKACLADNSACGKVYNIAYGEKIYLIDLYYEIARMLNKQIEPLFGQERAGDIKESLANISRAKRLLKYDPSINAKRGLELTIEWYKNNL